MPTPPPLRRVRRQWSRELDADWSMFRDPVRHEYKIPPGMYWPDKPYPVWYHIYSHCPTLFKEWAGQGKWMKDINFIRARALLKGICGHCWLRWREGNRS